MSDKVGVFAAIIPAAGQGRRAGGYKPLWKLGSGAVVDMIIEAAAVVCTEIRLVGGACFEELSRHVRDRHPDIILMENRRWADGGMFSSIQIGTHGLEGPAFVHPADVPGAGAPVYERLAAEYLESECEVIRPVYRGRGGHPVLLGPTVVREVRSASPDSNLRHIIAPQKRIDVSWEDELPCLDFDTPEQYAVLKAKLSGQPADRPRLGGDKEVL